jgi:hypothetical protein
LWQLTKHGTISGNDFPYKGNLMKKPSHRRLISEDQDQYLFSPAAVSI